jgi:hypothetical protein
MFSIKRIRANCERVRMVKHIEESLGNGQGTHTGTNVHTTDMCVWCFDGTNVIRVG